MANQDYTSIRPNAKRQLIDNGDGTHSVPTNEPNVFALIDSSDAPAIEMFSWRARQEHGAWRVITTTARRPRSTVPLTHVILGRPLFGLVIDHINRNPLDNRRVNLRFATLRGNASNLTKGSSSGFIGVSSPRPRHASFSARLRINGKSVYLGRRKTAKKAAELYDTAVRVIGEDTSLTNGTIDSPTASDITTVFKALKRHGMWDYYLKATGKAAKRAAIAAAR